MHNEIFDVPTEFDPFFTQALETPNHPNVEDNPLAIVAKNILIRKRFLLPVDYDELESLKATYNHNKHNSTYANYAIVLTHSCNLRCVYCNQMHAGSKWQDNEIQTIKRLLERAVASLRFLDLTWWGGEPLLKISLIQHLSSYAIQLCDHYGVNYGANISTNGVLLSPDNCRTLKQCKVNRIQITIDGPQEIHDKQRLATNGSGTYKQVLTGIENLVNSYNVIKKFVMIRMNLSVDTPTSLAAWQPLLDDLSSYKEFIKLAFTPVVSTFRFSQSNVVDSNEFIARFSDAIATAKEMGFYLAESGGLLREPGKLYCTAVTSRNYFILPGLRLTKCTHRFNDPAEDCGRLNHDGSMSVYERANEWNSFSPFECTACRECTVLPACMGGCQAIDFDDPSGLRCHIKHAIHHMILQSPDRKKIAGQN